MKKNPFWIKEIIENHLAIKPEDIKKSDSSSFMTRALITSNMPYKDPKVNVFKKENGNFILRIIAGYEGGIPFGIYPRILISWVSTEAVRTQIPLIELGKSLSSFLREVLGIQKGGGKRGSSTIVLEQMQRLFSSFITAQYTDKNINQGNFMMSNLVLADYVELYKTKRTKTCDQNYLWIPQQKKVSGVWNSKIKLSENFFEECINKPITIDFSIYKTFKGSPLAMDIYTWLIYRTSYTKNRSKVIRWEVLINQFGSNYSTHRAILDFKKAFLKALETVQMIYNKIKIEVVKQGVILLPLSSNTRLLK